VSVRALAVVPPPIVNPSAFGVKSLFVLFCLAMIYPYEVATLVILLILGRFVTLRVGLLKLYSTVRPTDLKDIVVLVLLTQVGGVPVVSQLVLKPSFVIPPAVIPDNPLPLSVIGNHTSEAKVFWATEPKDVLPRVP
jgi:hypothetical protein